MITSLLGKQMYTRSNKHRHHSHVPLTGLFVTTQKGKKIVHPLGEIETVDVGQPIRALGSFGFGKEMAEIEKAFFCITCSLPELALGC